MNTSVHELILAGAHFGHRVRFSNPKMSPYIYGKYRSTHIINLDYTVEALSRAVDYLKSAAESNSKILYVCTKSAVAHIVAEVAGSVDMPYVNQRWLGGILTNFKTTRNSVERLEKIEAQIAEGALRNMTKKEGIKLLLAKEKLEKAIGGIRSMTELPDALFIIDAGWHKGAVREANKLGIPVVSVVDTNHSPDNIDYVIPGNDDSREAISIYLREITAAVAAGKTIYEEKLLAEIKARNAYHGVEAPEKISKIVVDGGRSGGRESSVIVKEKPARPLRKPADEDSEGKI